MVISGCMVRLHKSNADMHDLLVDYYVFGMTFIQLARKHGCSDGHIGKRLQRAEGFINGCLMALDVKLEMDRYVQSEPVGVKFPVETRLETPLKTSERVAGDELNNLRLTISHLQMFPVETSS